MDGGEPEGVEEPVGGCGCVALEDRDAALDVDGGLLGEGPGGVEVVEEDDDKVQGGTSPLFGFTIGQFILPPYQDRYVNLSSPTSRYQVFSWSIKPSWGIGTTLLRQGGGRRGRRRRRRRRMRRRGKAVQVDISLTPC